MSTPTPPPGPLVATVAVTAAGRAAAARLAAAWGGRVRSYPREDLARAVAECSGVVLFLATGAAVRLLAPLLVEGRLDKATGAGVVCVDESGRFAVSLLGGHAGGANALAEQVAAVLGAEPVVTTASDATARWGLDTWAAAWGARLEADPPGTLAAVGRALLEGAPVRLAADRVAPWPPLALRLPEPGGPAPVAELVVTDRADAGPPGAPLRIVVRPPSLRIGVGSSRGVPADEVLALIAAALGEAGLSPASVTELVTATVKQHEPGLLAAAAELGVALRAIPEADLATVAVPHPSEVVRAAIGIPSVAEAAACHGGGELVVGKRRSAAATVAVARVPVRGRLTVIGLGPGARDLMTPRAATALRAAAHVVGLDSYLEQVADLISPGAQVHASGLGAEEQRAELAVRLAESGASVALIGSGDAGVYAMAAPALAKADAGIDVVGVPGVTAALAAAALLGAPLGHDHCAISLSDLHTPWEVIERRVQAAADADFVVTFYNPRSRGRDWQLPRAVALLAAARPPDTPVGVVRNASRPGESVTLSTLASLDVATVDMTTVVVVGNRASRAVAGRMVTPRGYRWEVGT